MGNAVLRKFLSNTPAWVWGMALLPRVALVPFMLTDPGRCLRPDSVGYLSLAKNLFHLGIFSSSLGPEHLPDTFRTPGYPLFLALFLPFWKDPVLPAAFFQCLLGALTVVFVWHWLKDISTSMGAGLGAAFLALDPITVLHAPIIMSEILFTFLLTIASWALWRGYSSHPSLAQAAWGGFLIGLTAMVRPISIYLPLLLCWRWIRHLRPFSAFLLAAYLLPAVWTARNWRVTGHPVFTSIIGRDSLIYAASSVESLHTGKPWGDIARESVVALDAQQPMGYANEAAQSKVYGSAARRIFLAHPLLLARHCLWGAVKVLGGTGLEMIVEWGGYETPGMWHPPARTQATGQGTLGLLRRHPGLIPIQVVYMFGLAILYLFSMLGLWQLWKKGHRAQTALLAICLAYFLGLSSTQGYYRFRIPMMPFLAVAAAVGFQRFRVTRA